MPSFSKEPEVEEDHTLGEDTPAQAVAKRGQLIVAHVDKQRHPAQRVGDGHLDLRSAIRQSELEYSDRRMKVSGNNPKRKTQR